MALVIGQNATVATGMSPIVETNIYADDIFADGLTFTSEHNIGQAGQIQVVIYNGSKGVAPSQPGANFATRDYTNTVVDINVNNSFKDSVKVPSYFESTMPVDLMMDKTFEVTQKVRDGRQQSAIAALIVGGTSEEAELADAITVDNIEKVVLSSRKVLRKKNAHPGVVIASVDTYSTMLEKAGTRYTPISNDDTVRTGRIGYWMGMLWIESTLLDQASDWEFLDEAGQKVKPTQESVDFIMYDYKAFSIVDRLDCLRVKESEQFCGSLVQEELVSGFKVTNKDCVLVHSTKNA